MDATGMGFGMWIFWIIVLLVVILVVKLLVSAKSQQNFTSPESPIEILKKRYASGEIDDEEYGRMKNDLER